MKKKKRWARVRLGPVFLISCRTRAGLGPERLGLGPKFEHTEEDFVDGSCSSCGDMTISELHKRLRYVNHGEVTLGQRCIRWSQSWFEDHGEGFPKWSSSPLKHSAVSGAAEGSRWALCWTEWTTHFLRCPLWRPDVDRCIGGRALSFWVWWPSCVGPFGCGSVDWARPRDDGHAFPGSLGWPGG